MSPVTVERDGNVAVLVIENPPVNAMAHAVRVGLLEAIEAADADASAQAIVICAKGKTFVAGADIREFDAGPSQPLLNDVLLRLELSRKPVIAALNGAALGGGFELALTCHYRCATPRAQVGLPEVKLGLLPGAGGTQRLPRLVGVKTALDLMTAGEPIGRDRMEELGIVDRVFETEDLRSAAIAWARELAEKRAPLRRLRDEPIRDAAHADTDFFAGYRKALPRATRKLEAAERIVKCVEAAVKLPFDEALAESRRLFEECRTSTESRALRYLFFAERGVASDAGASRAVNQVAVIGSGTMGAGIAVSLATNAIPVVLIDTEPKALEAGVARIRAALDGAVQKGRLNASQAAEALERVTPTTQFEQAAGADLVIEAVFERLSIKQDVFRRLDAICRPNTVLATNTSTLDVNAIAESTERPRDVVGMHFFSPANVMRLVEIVRAPHTSPEVVATALAVTKRIGKLGVVVGNCFGFVGNRMLYGYGRENQLMLLEGVAPERIDRVLESFGMAMGPNAVGDLAGLDIGYAVRRERTDLPDDPRYYRVADLLVERGRLGQKAGRGIYRYAVGSREPIVDPEVAGLIAAEAEHLRVARRTVSDAEIVERCLYALINEGARIIEEGIARSAADIDVIWANGYGFPRARGGPMFYADTIGLPNVLATIRRFERELDTRYWQPAPLLVRLAESGRSFAEAASARR